MCSDLLYPPHCYREDIAAVFQNCFHYFIYLFLAAERSFVQVQSILASFFCLRVFSLLCFLLLGLHGLHRSLANEEAFPILLHEQFWAHVGLDSSSEYQESSMGHHSVCWTETRWNWLVGSDEQFLHPTKHTPQTQSEKPLVESPLFPFVFLHSCSHLQHGGYHDDVGSGIRYLHLGVHKWPLLQLLQQFYHLIGGGKQTSKGGSRLHATVDIPQQDSRGPQIQEKRVCMGMGNTAAIKHKSHRGNRPTQLS